MVKKISTRHLNNKDIVKKKLNTNRVTPNIKTNKSSTKKLTTKKTTNSTVKPKAKPIIKKTLDQNSTKTNIKKNVVEKPKSKNKNITITKKKPSTKPIIKEKNVQQKPSKQMKNKESVKKINKVSQKNESITLKIHKQKSELPAEVSYTKDTIFMTDYLKNLEQYKVLYTNLELLKLKKIIPILASYNKSELIKNLYDDLPKTLETMQKTLNIPQSQLFENFHKFLMNPSPSDNKQIILTLDSLQKLATKPISKIHDMLNNYYNTIFHNIFESINNPENHDTY